MVVLDSRSRTGALLFAIDRLQQQQLRVSLAELDQLLTKAEAGGADPIKSPAPYWRQLAEACDAFTPSDPLPFIQDNV